MALTLTHSFESGSDLISARLMELVEEENLSSVSNASWQAEKCEVDECVASYQSDTWTYLILKFDEVGYAYVTYGFQTLNVMAMAASMAESNEIIDRLKLLFPEYISKDPNVIPVTFWVNGQHGPQSMTRNLDVPTWDEISKNYTESIRDGLSTLMNSEWRPGTSGQLLLWFGDAGTGKTTALRAMAREWKAWCDIHYIVDVEQFFSADGASYMMNVLVGGEDDEKWRLIVLEDSGELLTTDAKQNIGQALSRFLNIVDGMIGQGLKILVLVTTNEPVGKLHEAVGRPGRCACKINFRSLSPGEVSSWMEEHGVEPKNKKMNLAELYALTEDFNIIDLMETDNSIGFGS